MSEKMEQYKLKCTAYLSTIDIHRLRAYGRSIGVSRPAAKDKEELIQDIVAILAFELAPIERSNRGAPVKNDAVDERIPAKIAEIKAECFPNGITVEFPPYDFQAERERVYQETQQYGMLVVNDPAVERDGAISKIVSRGQVSYVDGEWILLPLDASVSDKKIPIPLSLVEQYALRDGDVITCNYREKDDWQKVEIIISVNGIWVEQLKERPRFDECNVCYSQKPFELYENGRFAKITHKCIDWIFPLTRGQRACVISAPKAGKTKTLFQLAEATKALNSAAEVFVLLIDQSYETVGEFRRVFGDTCFLYTTYEDDADRQVFVADYLLKRAKRYAESGKDVVLFVDSLTALAHAFNDTEASMGGKTLPCGLEVKTIHYLKKYFGSARCLENGGSITMVGAVGIDTGDPMDEIIARELSDIATMEFVLNNELAVRRIYPAIDFEKTQGKYNTKIKTKDEEEAEFLLKSVLLPKLGTEGILNLLRETKSKEDFIKIVKTESIN